MRSYATAHKLRGVNATTTLIRALRDSGLKQTEISRRTGIAQWRLSRWEAGVVPSAADAALRLKALHDELVVPVDPAPGEAPALAAQGA